MFSDTSLWLIIGVGGMLGGLLYGMRDHTLTFPYREDKHTLNPGFLVDLLFGLAGGFIIFIIIPGSFNYTQGGWATVQILGLAGVGGYGGRAVVEKLVNEQIEALEKDVHRLQNQSKWDAIAIKLLDQHLDDDADTPQIPKEQLKEAISHCSSSAKVQIFDKARQFRKECMENESLHHLMPQAISVFECLIEDDRDQKYHRNSAQLGFIMKDMDNPDWKRAEEALAQAIQIRDKQKEPGFLVYEFNRALCRIQLASDLALIKADLEAALKGEKTANWVRRPNPKLAPELIRWLQAHRPELNEWILAQHIELP